MWLTTSMDRNEREEKKTNKEIPNRSINIICDILLQWAKECSMQCGKAWIRRKSKTNLWGPSTMKFWIQQKKCRRGAPVLFSNQVALFIIKKQSKTLNICSFLVILVGDDGNLSEASSYKLNLWAKGKGK